MQRKGRVRPDLKTYCLVVEIIIIYICGGMENTSMELNRKSKNITNVAFQISAERMVSSMVLK